MKRLYDLANLTLLFLTGLLLTSWYPRLPERVPMHFNMAGQPDRWGGRGAIVMLFVVPLAMTAVFYLLIRYIPRLGANPRHLNVPNKEEFLRLPAEKREIYWALFKEFFAGLTVAINLLFYLIIRGTLRVATGAAGLLTFRAMLPALALIVVLMVFYFRRLFTLPGKLIRGEE
jgi:uncharacterized membrane protein